MQTKAKNKNTQARYDFYTYTLILSIVLFILPFFPYIAGASNWELENVAPVTQNPSGLSPFYSIDENSYLMLKNSQVFDLKPGEHFVVFLQVRFSELPRPGYRQNLVSKFASDVKPYPGWAIAIRNLQTSIRPEVYWRGKNGKGGWHTFDKVNIKPHAWYGLGLVVKEGEFINLFFEDIHQKSEPTFLGGHSINTIITPNTDADILFGSHRHGPNAFTGDIATILIAHPKGFPDTIFRLKRIFQGGLASVINRMSLVDEVSLWLTEPGLDSSIFTHSIETKKHRS
jgi:hypothetical protein